MERVVSVMALAAALSSCSSARPAAQAPAACEAYTPVLAVTASDRINASSSGQARPVQLRLYQLKSDARLKTAKFEDVWQSDATALEGDLVKVEEYTVYPGQTRLVKVTPAPDTHTLAAVALFREPQGKNWFLTYDVEPPKKDGPCQPGDPHIPVWLDRMQIEDGQGHATDSESKGN